MAVQRPKIALNNAVFPFVASKAPRSVFVPQLDSAPRIGKGFVGTEDSLDYNLPQILYGENFMPVAEGLKSVGYERVIAPSANSDFDTIFPLRDSEENTVLYSPARGANYVYDSTAGAWTTESIPAIWAPTVLAAGLDVTLSRVTYAYVDGKTFVCYSRLRSNGAPATDMSIMRWDETTNTLAPATPVLANLPFPAGEIDGISSSNGYLLVWSGISVAWATFNGTAFDFASYANGNFTGSGNQIPEDVKGKITALIALPGGFVIFTTKNAVAANYYAQSLSSPWVFREVSDCGGLQSYEQASVEGNLGSVMAYTTAGLQRVTMNSAELLHPAVSDFISGRQLDRYDFEAHAIIEGGTTSDFYVKVTAISSRYLVVSYGFLPGVYSYALVYDIGLKRWGKLRIVHRDAFYFTQTQSEGFITYSMLIDVAYSDIGATAYDDLTLAKNEVVASQHSIAFLLTTGEVKIATWSNEERIPRDDAVVVLGRVQMSRSSMTQLNRLELEGANNCTVYVQPSQNGRTLQTAEQLTVVDDEGDYLRVGGMVDCVNFNIAVEGQFSLSTIIVEALSSGQIM